jgi:hypothetical protein
MRTELPTVLSVASVRWRSLQKPSPSQIRLGVELTTGRRGTAHLIFLRTLPWQWSRRKMGHSFGRKASSIA